VCACGTRLRDAKGEPALAAPGRYVDDPILHCPDCQRRYVYVPDAETLHEQPGALPQGALA
jgi:hypothetical protein